LFKGYKYWFYAHVWLIMYKWLHVRLRKQSCASNIIEGDHIEENIAKDAHVMQDKIYPRKPFYRSLFVSYKDHVTR